MLRSNNDVYIKLYCIYNNNLSCCKDNLESNRTHSVRLTDKIQLNEKKNIYTQPLFKKSLSVNNPYNTI